VHALKRKLLRSLALAAAAVVIVIFAMPNYRQGEPSVAGRTAPVFAFDVGGKAARLSDLRGQVVVLNFWATWCPPCVEEMPSLNHLHERLAKRGVTILGVSSDEDAATYDQFLRDHHVAFPTYRDPTKKISSEYGTFMYPETYIIGRDGRIARKIIGPQKWDSPDLVSYLESLRRVP
jgi:cytochrome c biogenesis protein CcmG, thiol:disulfide interchange protein DsbE